MNEIGVVGVYPRVLVVLIFGAIAFIVFVENIVVVDQRVRCARKELEQQFFHLGVEHSLYLMRVIKILALRFAMRERNAKLVHALCAIRRESRVVLLDAPCIP